MLPVIDPPGELERRDFPKLQHCRAESSRTQAGRKRASYGACLSVANFLLDRFQANIDATVEYLRTVTPTEFRQPGAARAGGYVLAAAGLLVALGLLFHPVPAGGFEEKPSVLMNTPWWGPIHIAIAAGFVAGLLGGVLMLVAGGGPPPSGLPAVFLGAPAGGQGG